MSNDNLIIYYAAENQLVVHCNSTGYLLFIKNSKEPDVMPKSGLLELSTIYGEKLDRNLVMDKLADYIKLDRNPAKLGSICLELDTYNDDEEEKHLILDGEDEELVETIDAINEYGFFTIGSLTFHTEFNKLFFSQAI